MGVKLLYFLTMAKNTPSNNDGMVENLTRFAQKSQGCDCTILKIVFMQIIVVKHLLTLKDSILSHELEMIFNIKCCVLVSRL
jgi:hypothetical protein